MIKKDKHRRIWVVLLIMNLCFIWGNSLLDGNASRAFSDWVMRLLSCAFPVSGGEGTGLLRKLAHFLEFASLGVILSILTAEMKKWKYPLMWGILTACVDETIQIFVPGRGPALRDVLIDSCGVLTGMLLLKTGYILWKKKRS